MDSEDWFDRACRDPERVAADADAPAAFLLALAASFPEVVATNPVWTLNFLTGDDGTDAVLRRPNLRIDPNPLMNGLLRLLRSSRGDVFTKHLASRNDFPKRVLALTSPALPSGEAERTWQALMSEWSNDDLTVLQEGLDVLEYSGAPIATPIPSEDGSHEKIVEHIPQSNVLDKYLSRSPAKWIARWVGYGFGSHELHAQWIDNVFSTLLDPADETNLSIELGSWPNLSSENAERLFNVLMGTVFHPPKPHQPRFRGRRLQAGVADRAKWVLNILLTAPTTPAHVLGSIHEVLLHKPHWLLYTRENPDQATDGMLRNLATHPHTPTEVLESLARREDCREALLANPAAPDSLTEKIVTRDMCNRNSWVPLQSAPEWYANMVLEQGGPTFPPMAIAIAYTNPNITKLPDPGHFKAPVRTHLAKRNPLPLHAARTLARDRSQNVRQALAQHSHSPEVHALLAKDPDASVRAALAGNLRASFLTLSRLYSDKDPSVAAATQKPLKRYLPIRRP